MTDNGTDEQPTDPASLPRDTELLHEKYFHHGNLRLQLLHDKHWDVLRINIHRRNDRTNTDLWGIWDVADHAACARKFWSIKL